MSVFAVVFTALAVVGSSGSSATWDEPIHLTAGYLALARQDFRIDPSHPPLLRMWAALPLLAMGSSVHVDTRPVDAASPLTWLGDAYGFAHRFMYVDNDADRMLGAARFMVVLLSVILGILVFSWARAWLGLVPAAAALALFTLEPNLLAHGSLVTTDLGLTTFVFGSVYFVWRTCEQPTRLHAIAAACCAGLAAASKFSAVLLAPIVILLLVVAVMRRALSVRAAAALAVLMIATTVLAIWASYGFRFLPSESPAWAFDFADTPLAARHPVLAALAGWVDRHRLLPNAYTQGFLYAQSSADAMPSFLAGQRSNEGWWYYFPIAFLIKTPIALLACLALGLIAGVSRVRKGDALPLAFIGVPIVVFLGAAMASGINLGLRHILPMYPFVLLIAAVAVNAVLAARVRWAPAALVLVLAGGSAELAHAYPHPLSFFNQFVGGPANGFRYLADSNLGWGSNLKRLKAWMDRNGVRHVNLAYFGQADPAYYGINSTHLPGAPGFATDAIARPTLPGYVAISPTIMHGVYSPPHWQLFYAPFTNREPVAVIGNSLRIYWVEQWPEAVGTSGRVEAADAHRTLGDALMLGLHWPQPAVVHYREYVRQRPRDAGARVTLGIALAASGRTADAVPVLESAVDVDPGHGEARLTLARALFGSGDLAGAAFHAERAVELRRDDPDAHDFLGRVRAAQGRFTEALEQFRLALQIDPSHADARAHAARLTGTP